MARFHDSQEIFSDGGAASEKGRERGASAEEWEEPEGGSVAGRSGGGHPNRQLVGGRKSQKSRPTKTSEVVDKLAKSGQPPLPPAPPPRKSGSVVARPHAPREDVGSGTSSGDSSGELSDGGDDDDDEDEDDQEGEVGRAAQRDRKRKKSSSSAHLLPPKRSKKKTPATAQEVISLAEVVGRSASPELAGKKKGSVAEAKGKPKGKQPAKKRKLVLALSSDDDESDDDSDEEDDPLFRGLPALARRKIKGRYKRKADNRYKKKLQKVGLILIKSSSR